jgi:molybdenum cofactor synthesis domain-containing protein
MIALADVLASVLDRCVVRAGVEVRSHDAAGLVLAGDIVSSENVPPFDNTAVDGYAVRTIDVATAPVELRVTAEIAAGSPDIVGLGAGEAVRIMTGAPIPPGCDGVVMVEDTERIGSDGVCVLRAVAPGSGIRPVGSDVRVGETVLVAGTVVTPAVAGVLATVNARTVRVHPRVRVGVLSTGDELVDDGSPLSRGQIRESNRTMLVRLAREAGAEPVDMGIVGDDPDVVEKVLRRALDSGAVDALVTSGGVSMGDFDPVKLVLPRLAEMSWHQIAMKPAKPFAFGVAAGPTGAVVPIFGLPGNPVSSLVSFEVIARPALRTMMGFGAAAHRPVVHALLDEDVVRSPDGKVHIDRAVSVWGDDGRVHVRRARAQGSHQLAATATANCLVRIPDGAGLPAGSEVDVTFLGPDAGPLADPGGSSGAADTGRGRLSP